MISKIVRAPLSLFAALAIATSSALATVPAMPVFDISNFINMAKQYAQMKQSIDIYLAQLQKAKETIAFAKQQATNLTPGKWKEYKDQFKIIVAGPQFVKKTTAQQKVTLEQFRKIFPRWTDGMTYSDYATQLSDNTKGAAQQLIDSADKNDKAFAGEKMTLDTLTDFHPKTQAQQLDVMILLLRQDIEQAQKLRLLTSKQSSSMGTYYGVEASRQQATVHKGCESDIHSALVIAQGMNPKVQESDVRAYYLQRNPGCNVAP